MRHGDDPVGIAWCGELGSAFTDLVARRCPAAVQFVLLKRRWHCRAFIQAARVCRRHHSNRTELARGGTNEPRNVYS